MQMLPSSEKDMICCHPEPFKELRVTSMKDINLLKWFFSMPADSQTYAQN